MIFTRANVFSEGQSEIFCTWKFCNICNNICSPNIELAATQAMAKNAHKSQKGELTDLTGKSDRCDIITVANKVFGEGKWSYTVCDREFEMYYEEISPTSPPRHHIHRYRSEVRIQLENGNFHEDRGLCSAEGPTKDLALYKARIGSIAHAFKKVLLSLGERELQQLQRQMSSEQANTFATAEPMDLAVDFPDLISEANKVFGENKWSYTVVDQVPYFDNNLYYSKSAQGNCRAACLSFVKVQLENGNFREDVGYYNAEERTKGLAIHSARIGSVINALKRVLLTFEDNIGRELQQLQRQIIPKQVNHIQRDMAQSWLNTFAEPLDLVTDLPDLISAANKVFGDGKWSYTIDRIRKEYICTNNAADEIDVPYRCCAAYSSSVKVQLENGTIHARVGYYKAEESTKDLAIQNARNGSVVTALKRIFKETFWSFGGEIESELLRQQLQRQMSPEQVNTLATAEPMDLAVDLPDLISVANKVFGESKWSYTVIDQILDFVDVVDKDEEYEFEAPDPFNFVYHAGCVSYVKVQLEDGTFHEDVGYCSTTGEQTKGLSILNVRIGSAINALRRVLLSFGERIESELQQLQRQISPEQTDIVQGDVAQSLDKQISENLNASDFLRSEMLRVERKRNRWEEHLFAKGSLENSD